jgi:hypothetical protein
MVCRPGGVADTVGKWRVYCLSWEYRTRRCMSISRRRAWLAIWLTIGRSQEPDVLKYMSKWKSTIFAAVADLDSCDS